MSEVEKLKAEMKILEAENRQLEIEISKHLNCYEVQLVSKLE